MASKRRRCVRAARPRGFGMRSTARRPVEPLFAALEIRRHDRRAVMWAAMIWQPSSEFVHSTNVWRFMKSLGFTDREAFLQFSRDEPQRFWDAMMRELRVEWFAPYHTVMDLSRGPEWSQWFLGGKLNIAHNCVDRWADSDRVACIWESESGETRQVTFRELRADANRVANGLIA